MEISVASRLSCIRAAPGGAGGLSPRPPLQPRLVLGDARPCGPSCLSLRVRRRWTSLGPCFGALLPRRRGPGRQWWLLRCHPSPRGHPAQGTGGGLGCLWVPLLTCRTLKPTLTPRGAGAGTLVSPSPRLPRRWPDPGAVGTPVPGA